MIYFPVHHVLGPLMQFFRPPVFYHKRKKILAIMAIVSLLPDDASEDENQDAEAEHVPLELLPLR